MAENPVLPIYYNDLDRSTRDWTDAEFGCYVRLLMHQWAQGEIPKETHRLTRIVTSMESSWVVVGKKFIETETGLKNERLEKIRSERLAFLKKQSENGKKGGRKPKNNPLLNPNNNPKQSLHIEDEIEIEIEKRNIKGVQGEKQFSDELTNVEVGAAKEYVHITAKRFLNDEQIKEYWKAYLIHSAGEYHHSRARQLQHFRNWLKLQPHDKPKQSDNEWQKIGRNDREYIPI